MSNFRDKRDAAAGEAEKRKRDADVVYQQFAELFDTDLGREVLVHLWKRFDVCGRSFLAMEHGEVNALRAGVRDGERAVPNYILQMIRKTKPEFPTP